MNHPAKSKINAAAIVISVVTLIVTNVGMSAENQIEVLKFTGLVVPALIVTFRTWLTDKSNV